MERALATDQYAHDFRVVWDDGSVHWLFARAKIFRDASGAPESLLGVNVALTELKPADDSLRHSDGPLSRPGTPE